jgi:hypothetical protein
MWPFGRLDGCFNNSVNVEQSEKPTFFAIEYCASAGCGSLQKRDKNRSRNQGIGAK